MMRRSGDRRRVGVHQFGYGQWRGKPGNVLLAFGLP